MTDEELEEMANRILDQWAEDLADDPGCTIRPGDSTPSP